MAALKYLQNDKKDAAKKDAGDNQAQKGIRMPGEVLKNCHNREIYDLQAVLFNYNCECEVMSVIWKGE